MKVLIFLVLASLASADWTCEECEKVMKVIEMSTVSEEGIKEQIEILVAEVCPKVPNVEECVAELPGFWTKLSPIMWTYAYDPKIWCGDLCGSVISKTLPLIGIGESANLNKINNQKITGAVKKSKLELRDVTCEECTEGLHNVFLTFSRPETVQWLVDYMVGPAFCEKSEDVEKCKKAITELLPLAMPPLVADEDPEEEKQFCQLVLGVC